MRGVTENAEHHGARVMISTRTPHAGSDLNGLLHFKSIRISTRTPHAGSDLTTLRARLRSYEFQPALPMRGVTPLAIQPGRRGAISTRTPHAGSDNEFVNIVHDQTDFNPHSPCGE